MDLAGRDARDLLDGRGREEVRARRLAPGQDEHHSKRAGAEPSRPAGRGDPLQRAAGRSSGRSADGATTTEESIGGSPGAA